MIQVRCPQCSTTLALKQAPPAGKVKCPKCAAIVVVGKATVPGAPSAASPAAARAAGAARPANQPARLSPQAVAKLDDDIDFRTIPVPSIPAPSGQFPVLGQARIYDGPISLDPIPKQRSDDEDEDNDDDASPTSATNKKSAQAKVLVYLVAGLISFVVVGAGVFWMMGGAGGGGTAGGSVDLAAVAAAAAPTGYQAKSLNNCIVLMPNGSWGADKKAIPSSIESEVVMSDATSSVFLLAVMDGGSQPIDADQIRKKASRSLGGDILGGQPVERNGYTGIKGVVDGSLYIPRMEVEVFHHDGRFAIIGHALGSAMRSAAGGEASVVGGSPEEQKEVEVFLNSFKIGPPKGGIFSN